MTEIEIILIQVLDYLDFKIDELCEEARKEEEREEFASITLNEKINDLKQMKKEADILINASFRQNNSSHTRFIGVDEELNLCELTVIKVTVIYVRTSPSFSPSLN